MARSFKTYKFKNDSGTKANDLHIIWGITSVEIIGVDGIKPDDPKADYSLSETGGKSDIGEHEVAKGETVKVRVKTPHLVPPKRVRYQWTFDGKAISKFATIAFEDPDEDDTPEEVAVRRFEERMDVLSDRLEMLIDMNRLR
ncbi:hypothetical protein JM93_00957 [Roseibium hamelinense]|uniref:Uncharacterized protein n=1 Tax=Roseibium hamelinense TaxID=150831 RepID=A0A562TKC2_9HYPH|nr:hypothetical protein [Roseibium hamelinense]MTI42754.1 hypothetical protein [Roseibium hamelinense]TWI93400.1 hypothetical protein JM93_00957 [Roseibium hamelinense]